jgi:hypothetical protein
MKLDPVIERMRARDDQATGLACEMLGLKLPDADIAEVYEDIKRRCERAHFGRNDREMIVSLMANIGFWAVVEAMEREIREDEEANP